MSTTAGFVVAAFCSGVVAVEQLSRSAGIDEAISTLSTSESSESESMSVDGTENVRGCDSRICMELSRECSEGESSYSSGTWKFDNVAWVYGSGSGAELYEPGRGL